MPSLTRTPPLCLPLPFWRGKEKGNCLSPRETLNSRVSCQGRRPLSGLPKLSDEEKTDPSTESITVLLGSLGKLREGGKGTPDRKSVFNGKWTLPYTQDTKESNDQLSHSRTVTNSHMIYRTMQVNEQTRPWKIPLELSTLKPRSSF